MTAEKAIFSLQVETTSEAEDAVTELLERLTGRAAVSYFDLETQRASVTAYIESKTEWDDERAEQLRSGLERIREAGIHTGSGHVAVSRVSKAWMQSWKRHFKPLNIGNKLLIQPTWSTRKPSPGQRLIVMDPGLSFGTGQHPTTAFCLSELVRRRKQLPGNELSFLDLGTGSGILSIAASKLGFRPVSALDFDPESVRVARGNARRNRVSVPFARKDILAMPLKTKHRFSVVCANVTADILIDAKTRIVARVAPQGLLVLAGILEREFQTVQWHYERMGLRLVRARTAGEWRSGAFEAA